MYSAAPCATRRTLAKVKSSATIPRQPSVPNLIWSAIAVKVTFLQVAGFARPPERVHDLLDILRTRAGTHEEGVLGVDADHVLESDRGDEPLVPEDQAAMGVDLHGLTVD